LIRKLEARAEFGESTDFLEAQIAQLGVAIRLGSDLTADALSATDDGLTVDLGNGPEAFDEIVVATGARPRAADVTAPPGALRTMVEAMEDPDGIGPSVILYDAQVDQSAASAAEFLAATGRAVTVVTPADRQAIGIGLANEPPQLERLAAAGVKVIPYHVVSRVEDGGTVITHAYTGAEQRLEGITDVVAAVGWVADDDLYLALRQRSDRVRRAGDCVAPRDVGMAIYSAEELGRAL
jgi:thioredoxin reductase